MTDQNKKNLKIGLGLLAVLILGWYLYSGKQEVIPQPIEKDIATREGGSAADMASPAPASRLSLKSAGIKYSAPQASSLTVPLDESVAPVPEEPTAGETENTEKKVIKNGDLTMKVDKADESTDKIARIAKANGGEVVSSNFYKNQNNAKTGTITLKVPFDKFDGALAEIKKVATEVVRESTNSQDVTEQYTDLQSQLKNKQAEEEAIAKILSGAGKMDDILSVTRELSRVRGEIERLQGRIRYMDSQTDMSRVSVNLSEDPEITATESWRPWQIVKDSANSLVGDAQGFVDFLIVLIIRVIPTLVLYLLVIAIFYFLGRKVYRKFKKPSKPVNQ